MKKLLILFISCLICLSFTACGNKKEPEQNSSSETSSEITSEQDTENGNVENIKTQLPKTISVEAGKFIELPKPVLPEGYRYQTKAVCDGQAVLVLENKILIDNLNDYTVTYFIKGTGNFKETLTIKITDTTKPIIDFSKIESFKYGEEVNCNKVVINENSGKYTAEFKVIAGDKEIVVKDNKFVCPEKAEGLKSIKLVANVTDARGNTATGEKEIELVNKDVVETFSKNNLLKESSDDVNNHVVTSFTAVKSTDEGAPADINGTALKVEVKDFVNQSGEWPSRGYLTFLKLREQVVNYDYFKIRFYLDAPEGSSIELGWTWRDKCMQQVYPGWNEFVVTKETWMEDEWNFAVMFKHNEANNLSFNLYFDEVSVGMGLPPMCDFNIKTSVVESSSKVEDHIIKSYNVVSFDDPAVPEGINNHALKADFENFANINGEWPNFGFLRLTSVASKVADYDYIKVRFYLDIPEEKTLTLAWTWHNYLSTTFTKGWNEFVVTKNIWEKDWDFTLRVCHENPEALTGSIYFDEVTGHEGVPSICGFDDTVYVNDAQSKEEDQIVKSLAVVKSTDEGVPEGIIENALKVSFENFSNVGGTWPDFGFLRLNQIDGRVKGNDYIKIRFYLDIPEGKTLTLAWTWHNYLETTFTKGWNEFVVTKDIWEKDWDFALRVCHENPEALTGSIYFDEVYGFMGTPSIFGFDNLSDINEVSPEVANHIIKSFTVVKDSDEGVPAEIKDNAVKAEFENFSNVNGDWPSAGFLKINGLEEKAKGNDYIKIRFYLDIPEGKTMTFAWTWHGYLSTDYTKGWNEFIVSKEIWEKDWDFALKVTHNNAEPLTGVIYFDDVTGHKGIPSLVNFSSESEIKEASDEVANHIVKTYEVVQNGGAGVPDGIYDKAVKVSFENFVNVNGDWPNAGFLHFVNLGDKVSGYDYIKIRFYLDIPEGKTMNVCWTWHNYELKTLSRGWNEYIVTKETWQKDWDFTIKVSHENLEPLAGAIYFDEATGHNGIPE